MDTDTGPVRACWRCGHDLAGLGLRGVCPGCGASYGGPEPVPREERLRVEFDCEGCGYDLRGLAMLDDCPECGRAVWSSRPMMDGGAGAQLAASARSSAIMGVALFWTMVGGVVFGAVALRLAARSRERARRGGAEPPTRLRHTEHLAWAAIIAGAMAMLAMVSMYGWVW